MNAPTILTPEELEAVLNRVAPKGIEYAAARIVRMLAGEHSVQTVRINTRCSVGNISDQVSKFVNPRIADLGLYVACVKPPHKILNQYGQPSGQMLWSFYRDYAANDPCFDQQQKLVDGMRRDGRHLQEALNLPMSATQSTEDWVGSLQGVGVGTA